MRNHVTRLARFALVSACAALPLFMAGCEKSDSAADRDAAQQLKEAAEQRAIARDKAGKTAADNKLQQVASRKDTSEAARAAANAELGAAKYAQALALMSHNANFAEKAGEGKKVEAFLSDEQKKELGLAQKEQMALELIEQINALASQIAANNFDVAALNQNDPSRAVAAEGGAAMSPLDQLNKAKAEHVKQSESAAGKSKGVADEVAKLEGEIKALRGEADSASKQAVDLIDKSEHAKGQDAVNLYKQGVELRQKSANALFQAGQKEAQIKEKKALIAEFEQQKGLWDEAAAADQKAIDALKTTWAGIQDAAKARSSQSQAVLEKQGIAQRAGELAALLKETDAERAQVMGLLKGSEDAYKQAWEAARVINKAMISLQQQRTSPSLPAWEQMRILTEQYHFDIGRARALLAQGMLSLEERGVLEAERVMIQELSAWSLAPAKLPMPSELNVAQVGSRIDELTKAAREAFGQADAVIGMDQQRDAVVDANSDDKYEKSAVHLLAQYGLALTEGNGPEAQEALTRAKAQLKIMTRTDNGGMGLLLPQWPEDVETGVINRPAPTPPRPTIPTTVPAPKVGEVENPGNVTPGPGPAGGIGAGLGDFLKKAAGALSGQAPKNGPPNDNK